MSSAGSGVGGAAGGPQQPTIFELETRGGTEVARAAMKIVMDTLELPLLSVDQDTRKYQSSANRPTIPPLYTTRVATSYEPAVDESWHAVYQEFTKLMPQDFRTFFESAMQLNAGQRNRNITILDGVMQNSAKLLIGLRAAAAPLDAESLAAQRANDNVAMPYIALGALASGSGVLVSEGLKYLELVGPNDPNFDKIANALGDLALITEDLKTATHLLADKDTEIEGKNLLASAHDQIATLSTQYDRLGGGDFLLLGNLLHSAKLASAALLLGHLGAAALVMGMSNATFEIDKSSSALGLVGPGYSAFSHAMADSLQSIFLNKSTAGGELLGNHLIGTTLLTALLWGTLAYDNKGSQSDQVDASPAEIAEMNLAHELTLNFLTDSGILPSIGTTIAKESGADANQQAPMAALLEAGLLLMLVSPSIKGGDLASSGPLLKGISDRLNTTLAAGAGSLEAAANTGGVSQNFKVYFQQAAIALENGDEVALMNALGNGIEASGTTTSQFIGDIKDLKKTAHTTAEAVDLSRNAAASTGISQAA